MPEFAGRRSLTLVSFSTSMQVNDLSIESKVCLMKRERQAKERKRQESSRVRAEKRGVTLKLRQDRKNMK